MTEFPRLLEVMTTAWDTSGGQALRALVWSIYNDRVPVPLWSALTDLDDPTRVELCRLLALGMDSRAAALGQLIRSSGEWDRVDTQPLRWVPAD
jgi:hypothetical protein